MDERPIGVFDSGLGGLTAVRALRSALPEEDLIYFGDTARVPYGSRARETLVKYARQDVRFLRTFDLKAILVACGTVSTTSLDVLQAENDMPILGVVEAACRQALSATRRGRIGVIATPASIRSGAYGAALRRAEPSVEVFEKACPLFVPLVENGRTRPGDIVIETVAREYLEPLLAEEIDTLLLGCTHYPLLAEVIGAVCGPEVTLISSGEAAALQLRELLARRGLQTREGHRGSAAFYVSDRPEDFESLASLFLQEDLHHMARRIDIEGY